MKLYEFVDKLYAMGDMEAPKTVGSKRTLNEAYGDTIETNNYEVRGYNPSTGEIDSKDFLIVDKDMHQMYYYEDLKKLIRRMSEQYDFEVSGEGFQKVIQMLLKELIQPDADYIRDLIVYFLSEVHYDEEGLNESYTVSDELFDKYKLDDYKDVGDIYNEITFNYGDEDLADDVVSRIEVYRNNRDDDDDYDDLDESYDDERLNQIKKRTFNA